jgi:hypothetical protein
MIVDPWGSIVAQCGDIQPYKPSFALADIVSLVAGGEERRHGTQAVELIILALLCSVRTQDLSSMASMRQEMPLWQQRRSPQLYPSV